MTTMDAFASIAGSSVCITPTQAAGRRPRREAIQHGSHSRGMLLRLIACTAIAQCSGELESKTPLARAAYRSAFKPYCKMEPISAALTSAVLHS